MKRKTKMSDFEHRICIRLAELDMRKVDLARKLRISPQALNTMLHRAKRAREVTIDKLAAALKTTPAHLRGDADKPKKKAA